MSLKHRWSLCWPFPRGWWATGTAEPLIPEEDPLGAFVLTTSEALGSLACTAAEDLGAFTLTTTEPL